MAKKKKVTINALEKATKEQYEPTTTVEWHGIEVVIKKTLSLGEMLGVVQGVVDVCFNQETGTYMPELKDYAMRIMVLENYANITMPSNLDKQYELVNTSDLFEIILSRVNQAQFHNICMAIDQKLMYNIEVARQQKTGLKAELENVLTQVTEFLEGADEDALKQIVEALGGAAGDGVNPSSLSELTVKQNEIARQVEAPREVGSKNNIVRLVPTAD